MTTGNFTGKVVGSYGKKNDTVVSCLQTGSTRASGVSDRTRMCALIKIALYRVYTVTDSMN